MREAAGLAAYHAGEWAEALAELRAARRLGAGEDTYLPVMADCERGLGRPERALDLVKAPEAKKLDPMGRVEMRIVESGARRDLGQFDAAVVTLQVPELRDRRLRPWSARLFYAYADALADAGRLEEASDWFAKSAAADRDGETDAAERYAEIEGLEIVDTVEGDEDTEDLTDDFDSPAAAPQAAPGRPETVQDEAAAPAAEPAPEPEPEDASAAASVTGTVQEEGPAALADVEAEAEVEVEVEVEVEPVVEVESAVAAEPEPEEPEDGGGATAIEFKAAPAEEPTPAEAEAVDEAEAAPVPDSGEESPEATVPFLEPTQAKEKDAEDGPQPE